MRKPRITDLIAALPASLGSYAPVLDEIEAALRSPQCNLTTVAGAIEKDPDLTARLLRLTNSAFYGLSSRLTTVSEAINLIGVQQVEDLIIVSSLVDRFTGLSAEYVDMRSFWRHSLACGIAARLLAKARRLPLADGFFVAGLLHDLGRLLLFTQAPEASAAVFEVYRRERVLLREAEKRVLDYDHAELGGALVRRWQFPDALAEAVAHHHGPGASQSAKLESSVVHVADHLVNAMQIGSSGERHVPPLQMTAWETLGLTTVALPSILSAIDEQLEAVEDVFVRRRPSASRP